MAVFTERGQLSWSVEGLPLNQNYKALEAEKR